MGCDERHVLNRVYQMLVEGGEEAKDLEKGGGIGK